MLLVANLAVMIAGVCSMVGFSDFKAMHAKKYASQAEETQRMGIFKANVARIQALNDEAKKNNQSVLFGVTAFSDLSPEEFISKNTGFKKGKRNRRDVVLDGDSTSVASKAVADTNVFGK